MLWISRYVISGIETVQPILDDQAFPLFNNKVEKVYNTVINSW